MKNVMVQKPKPKKRRPAPVVLVDPHPSWNLGRVARFAVTERTPTPAFLEKMIVKSKQGGPS
jgi:hypothetical protein